MRTLVILGTLALLCPAAALAQTAAPAAPAKSAAAPKAATKPAARNAGDITRDEYIERAKENAGRRFDRMDADHDGVLTAEERRAYRDAHRRGGRPASQ